MKLHKSPWYCLAPVLFTMLSIDARAVASATPPLGRQPLRVQSLDGPWRLVLDPKDIGQTQVWFKPDIFPLQASRPIEVPGSITEIDPKYDGVFWCSRSFTLLWRNVAICAITFNSALWPTPATCGSTARC